MKKFLSLLLAALMILSMVPFASAEGPIEITFWHSWGSGKNNEATEKLVADFNAANEGKIHVNSLYVGGYSEVLSKAMVGYNDGENPTVAVVDACMALNAAQYGIMHNLTDYTAENDPEYDWDQFFPGLLEFSIDEDRKNWTVPYARSTQVMYVNMDLVRQCLGADAAIPSTWDDVWKVCEAWTAQTGTPAYSHGAHSGWYAFYILSLYNGEFYNQDGTGACMYINDAWRKALNTWKDAIDKGWYMVPSLSTAGFYEDFMASKLPIMFNSTGSVTDILADSEGVFDVEVCYLPGGVTEDGSIRRAVQTGGANLMLANNKSAEETAAGWEFIKFMTSEEANIYHALTTGYLIGHVGAEQNEAVVNAWAAEPALRVSYDQLQFVHEAYKSIYCSELDMEETVIMNSFVMDGVSVEDTLKDFENMYETIMPLGVVDTWN